MSIYKENQETRDSVVQESPNSRPWTSTFCQISSSIRLEIKCTINVMLLHHPETIPPTPVHGKTFCHEIDLWCPSGFISKSKCKALWVFWEWGRQMICSVANTNNVFLNNYTKGELTALMQVSQAGNFYIPESCPKGSGSWACERRVFRQCRAHPAP